MSKRMVPSPDPVFTGTVQVVPEPVGVPTLAPEIPPVVVSEKLVAAKLDTLPEKVTV